MAKRTVCSLALALALGTMSLPTDELGNPDYEVDEDLRKVIPPNSAEVDELRSGLEQHWNGNLPALLAYRDSLDPLAWNNRNLRTRGARPPATRTTTTTNSATWSRRPRRSASAGTSTSSGNSSSLPAACRRVEGRH